MRGIKAWTLPAKLPGWDAPGWTAWVTYTLDDLLAVLSGQKEHTPGKSAVQAAPPKVNLLVDIQAKLQDEKAAGACWPCSTAKQMAQTMNFLTDHNLLNYAVEEKGGSNNATTSYLPQIKGGGRKRMAEIAVPRTTLSITRPVRPMCQRRQVTRNSRKCKYEADILPISRQKTPLMIWASRSCPPSKACKRSTPSCWMKRKKPMENTDAPAKKCVGSF